MFFTRSDHASYSNLLALLARYEKASGQCISPNKSAIIFSSKTPLLAKDRVKLSLSIEKEGGIGKYLGLPEPFGHKKRISSSALLTVSANELSARLPDTFPEQGNKYY